MADQPFGTVITDLQMPGMGGEAFLKKARRIRPNLPVIILTAHGTIENAVDAMKAGASDFLTKPFDKDEVLYVVNKSLAKSSHAANQPETQDLGDADQNDQMVGSGPVMNEVRTLIAKAARGMATVMIRGESGTGKELAARAIHHQSERASGPFVQINCAALPDNLFESELFGYERGAFTGANSRKPGRLELANGGTIFLDEIGDVSPAMQTKLLRVIQEREVERLGGTRTTKIDVRFVAATHQNLEEMVQEQTFREDLYYRLNVLPIRMPPLRERYDDLPALVARFCAALGSVNGRPNITMSPKALERLACEPWPGNIRQLQNFVERLIVLGDDDLIEVSDIERELQRTSALAPQSPATTATMDPNAAQRLAIEEALRKTMGNRAKAARILGVSRRTLYNRLEKLGIS